MNKIFLSLISFLIVAFGQPGVLEPFAILASFVGYTLFFRVLIEYSSKWHRFWLGTLWFSAVQAVQLFWFLSHPFYYIYPIYLFFVLAIGFQFGVISLFIDKIKISSNVTILFVSSLWTLFEWTRLFFLAGYTWNPIGLSLASNVLSLQMASLIGAYGLTFFVLFVNLYGLKVWIKAFPYRGSLFYILLALTPYLYGILQYRFHSQEMKKNDFISALLVHTAFPAEGLVDVSNRKKIILHTLSEWESVIKSLKDKKNENLDFIVFPEYAFFCGTYSCCFPYSHVEKIFKEHLGDKVNLSFPPLESPWARTVETETFVNNAFISKTLANFFNASVVVGLEDVDDIVEGGRRYVSAAQHFSPQYQLFVDRYEKRVLVPLGEYIPFEFCRKLAANYGVFGSFTPGISAKVFESKKVPFGLSICYEETFGDLMRENKLLGAGLLINLTSNSWYPYSTLADQHFYHARLRTVESGFPLIRSSNLGLTGGIDSLGNVIKTFNGENVPLWSADTLLVSIPNYNYTTLYSFVGDKLIVFISSIVVLFFVIKSKLYRL